MSKNEIPVTTIEKGSYCGVQIANHILITNKKEWQKLWDRFSTRVPKPEAPTVDFRREVVLAVFMGQKSSGGYSIEITNVEIEDGKLVARVQQKKFNGITTMAMTQPFHIASIPRKRGLPIEVDFGALEKERPKSTKSADAMKTYILMLDVDYEGVKEGDRAENLQASVSAIAAFRKTLKEFLVANQLGEESVKILTEFDHLGGFLISTTDAIAVQIRQLDGVDSMDEDFPISLA